MYYLKTKNFHTMTFKSSREISDFLNLPVKEINLVCRKKKTLPNFEIWCDNRKKNWMYLAIDDDKTLVFEDVDDICSKYLLSEEHLMDLIETGKATHDGVTFDILFDEPTDEKRLNSHGCWQKTLTIDGETHFIDEWGKIAKIRPDLIRWRLRHKKSPKDAVFAPVRKPLKKKKKKK